MKLKQLRNMLDKGEISAVELTLEYISKIKQDDTNSFITICEDEALNEAKLAQKMIESGRASSMTGIPVSVKDNILTKGVLTTCASKMLKDFVPDYDAEAVAKLKSQGAVILGKTNMDEFAMGSTSTTSYFGGVKNPHDLKKTAGGSSGGSSAAVAKGLCPVSLGSDTGGSVRQPAAFCSVAGLKPTYGRVSRFGVVSYASSMEQIGIISESAEDTGYVLSSISGGEYKDMTCIHDAEDFTRLCGMPLKDIKIGIIKELIDSCQPEIKKNVQNAIDVYKSMGARIIEVSIPSLEYAVSAYYIISAAEASSNLARFDGIRYGLKSDNLSDYDSYIKNIRKEGFGFEVKKRILMGNYVLGKEGYEKYYKKALYIRENIKKEYKELFGKCGCILTPTSTVGPGAIDKKTERDAGYYKNDMCTVSANMAELPSISVPCGCPSAPAGLCLTGPKLSEAFIIAVADRYEREVCL